MSRGLGDVYKRQDWSLYVLESDGDGYVLIGSCESKVSSSCKGGDLRLECRYTKTRVNGFGFTHVSVSQEISSEPERPSEPDVPEEEPAPEVSSEDPKDKEILQLKTQIAAMKLGIQADCVEDAVAVAEMLVSRPGTQRIRPSMTRQSWRISRSF